MKISKLKVKNMKQKIKNLIQLFIVLATVTFPIWSFLWWAAH